MRFAIFGVGVVLAIGLGGCGAVVKDLTKPAPVVSSTVLSNAQAELSKPHHSQPAAPVPGAPKDKSAAATKKPVKETTKDAARPAPKPASTPAPSPPPRIAVAVAVPAQAPTPPPAAPPAKPAAPPPVAAAPVAPPPVAATPSAQSTAREELDRAREAKELAERQLADTL